MGWSILVTKKKTCLEGGSIVQDGSGVFVGGKIFVGGGVFCLVLGEIFLRRLVGLVWQENLFFVGW